MSINDYLTSEQVRKIISIIKSQCDEASRKEIRESMRVPEEVYSRVKKGRKAHDITADVYMGFFYAENRIEGLKLALINNGIYSQPELTSDSVIIHIYHQSNMLDSKVVKERSATPGKDFFCIRFSVDKAYRLKTIEAVLLNGTDREKEMIYEAKAKSATAG